MDIISAKFTSGEEIIARLVSETEDTMTLNTVRLTVLTQGPTAGSLALQLMPWCYTCDQDGEMPPVSKATCVLINRNVPKELEDRYIGETSSIQLVK